MQGRRPDEPLPPAVREWVGARFCELIRTKIANAPPMEALTLESRCYSTAWQPQGRHTKLYAWRETTWAEVRARLAAQGVEIKHPEELYRLWRNFADDSPA
jgi:hypothetical protein